MGSGGTDGFAAKGKEERQQHHLPLPRVLLKISGETFSGGKAGISFDPDALTFLLGEILSAHPICRLAIVIGGGNIFRGSEEGVAIGMQKRGIPSANADYAGMYATLINACTLLDALERRHNVPVRLMNALGNTPNAEEWIPRRAAHHLGKADGRIVIIAAGMGIPHFSTDTAMVFRASEIGADRVLKGTKVDGIFDKDPNIHKDARLIPYLSHAECLANTAQFGRILDATAVLKAKELGLAIRVFNIFKPGNLVRAVRNEAVGSIITTPR